MHKLKARRFGKLLLIVLAMLLVIALAGCLAGNITSGHANMLDIELSAGLYDNLLTEVSIGVMDRNKVSSDEGTYEANRWTKWINENSGVKVKFVAIPRWELQAKYNALIAANEAPDLIVAFDRNYIANLANQGAISPVDEFIDKYSTVLKPYLAEHPELDPYLTMNGKTYAVTSARPLVNIANHGMWIRQDWLDRLQLKTPTTVEELIAVAKAFKEQDPDGNGQPDTLGIAFNGNFGGIIQAFFNAKGDLWHVENGKVRLGILIDRYKDVLAMRRTLYEQGLIDQEYITDKNLERERQFWTTGKAGIYLGTWSMENDFNMLLENVPDANPVPLEPVASQYGKFGLYQDTPAFYYIAFNKETKNPQAAVQYLDWLLDRGWRTVLFGFEGIHYKQTNGYPQMLDREKYDKEVRYAEEYAVLSQWDPEANAFPIMAASDPISQSYARLKGVALEVALKNKFSWDVPYPPTFPELTDLLVNFWPIHADVEAKVTVVGGEFTPEWGMTRLRSEWKRLGGDEVDRMVQEWYDDNNAYFKK